jgi:hypothetical protein
MKKSFLLLIILVVQCKFVVAQNFGYKHVFEKNNGNTPQIIEKIIEKYTQLDGYFEEGSVDLAIDNGENTLAWHILNNYISYFDLKNDSMFLVSQNIDYNPKNISLDFNIKNKKGKISQFRYNKKDGLRFVTNAHFDDLKENLIALNALTPINTYFLPYNSVRPNIFKDKQIVWKISEVISNEQDYYLLKFNCEIIKDKKILHEKFEKTNKLVEEFNNKNNESIQKIQSKKEDYQTNNILETEYWVTKKDFLITKIKMKLTNNEFRYIWESNIKAILNPQNPQKLMNGKKF